MRKEQLQKVAMWALLGLSGTGAVVGNIGGAAATERVAKIEAVQALEGARLDRIETKIDRLLERK